MQTNTWIHKAISDAASIKKWHGEVVQKSKCNSNQHGGNAPIQVRLKVQTTATQWYSSKLQVMQNKDEYNRDQVQCHSTHAQVRDNTQTQMNITSMISGTHASSSINMETAPSTNHQMKTTNISTQQRTVQSWSMQRARAWDMCNTVNVNSKQLLKFKKWCKYNSNECKFIWTAILRQQVHATVKLETKCNKVKWSSLRNGMQMPTLMNTYSSREASYRMHKSKYQNSYSLKKSEMWW
jgi:hypothetical protein